MGTSTSDTDDIFDLIDKHSLQYGNQWGMFMSDLEKLGLSAHYDGNGVWIINDCIILCEVGRDE